MSASHPQAPIAGSAGAMQYKIKYYKLNLKENLQHNVTIWNLMQLFEMFSPLSNNAPNVDAIRVRVSND